LPLGLANTIFFGFDYVNGFHINQVISNEERDVGRLLAATPTEPVYTYNWDYLDTMRYYAGGRKIGKMYDDQVLDESFFLIVHAEFGYQFPPEMQAHLQKVYAGPALTMYLFDL